MGATPRQRLSAVERRTQALQLHLACVDLRTIAKQVGYADASAAKKAIDRAIADSIARGEEKIDDIRREQIMRYHRLQAAHWGKAIKGDTKASDIVLKCMQGTERLQDLAAPKRISIDAQKLGDEILAMLADDDGAGSGDEAGAAP